MAIVARCQVADNLAVTNNGFVVVQQRFCFLKLELHHAHFQTLVFFSQYCIATDKIRLVGFYSEAEARFENVVFVGDVVTEMTIGLFYATGIHHMHSAQFQVKRCTGFKQCFEYMRCLIR